MSAEQINNCDGCQRGLPVNWRGIHYDPRDPGWGAYRMTCTKERYVTSDKEPSHDNQ